MGVHGLAIAVVIGWIAVCNATLATRAGRYAVDHKATNPARATIVDIVRCIGADAIAVGIGRTALLRDMAGRITASDIGRITLLTCCAVNDSVAALSRCAVRITGRTLTPCVALLTARRADNPIAARRIVARIGAGVGCNAIAVVTLFTRLENAVSAD